MSSLINSFNKIKEKKGLEKKKDPFCANLDKSEEDLSFPAPCYKSFCLVKITEWVITLNRLV